MRLDVALFEPDIPQNTAAILRTAVCFGARVHVVGPAAFDLSDRAVRRAGLDYAARARLLRHTDMTAFSQSVGRIVLFTTQGSVRLGAFQFHDGDTLLFGRESAGVPDWLHASVPDRVRIPMAADARSLNLAVAVGVGLSHALYRTCGFELEGWS